MIHRINPGSRIHVIPGIGVKVIAPKGGAAAVTGWWLAGGIDPANCIAAYQAKGAASLAASYDNLAAPGNGLADGTHDAIAGKEPTLGAGIGWQFNGSDQWLTTAANSPISGASARTNITYVRLNGAPAAYANVGIPSYGSAAVAGSNFELLVSSAAKLYGWVTSFDVKTTYTMTIGTWYALAFSYNGTRLRVRFGANSTDRTATINTTASAFRIAKDASNRYGYVDVACCAAYSIDLDDTQWAAVSAAMAAL